MRAFHAAWRAGNPTSSVRSTATTQPDKRGKPRVKYVLDEEADFLFVNFRQDTSIDTRFRDISKHTLSFSIWPSISIGPTLRLFLYQNKVNRDFLIQKEFGIETSISFDIFNRRETGVQFKYKP